MMSDCLFCGSDLFEPVPAELGPGERISFDPQLGRLWQVCPSCGRWNLAPIESRWEVVEECERIASSAKALLTMEKLSLLSCGAGQLVRIGGPARQEFAEWRYSSRLDPYAGRVRGRLERVLLSLPQRPVGGYDLHGTARAVPQAWYGSPFIDHGAALAGLFSNAPLAECCPSCAQPLFIHPASFGDLRFELSGGAQFLAAPCGLCGDEVLVDLREARAAIRAGLALVSLKYRDVAHVQSAVAPLDRAGGPHRFVARLAKRRHAIGELPARARLALWLALDEIVDAEALEAEWSRAETLARIADGELTEVRGFSEFRSRVLSDAPPQ